MYDIENPYLDDVDAWIDGEDYDDANDDSERGFQPWQFDR